MSIIRVQALILCAAAAICIAVTSAARADFNYTNFASVAGLTLNGNAAQTGNILRLTPAAEGQAGSAWYTTTKAHVSEGFDTTFVFNVSPGGADGFAFLIQNDSTTALGNGGSDMGYAGITSSIAIEFDTFGFFPESSNHLSVQSNGTGPNSASDADSLVQAIPPVDLDDGASHTVTIRYRPGVLLVFMDSVPGPIINITLDLQNIHGDNILDGSGNAWVGFTAGTGGLFATHDILSWNFDENSAPLPIGACCRLAGCVEASAHECETTLGGYYAGDNTTCAAVSCDGPCCNNDSCDVIPLAGCAKEGGSFLGVDDQCYNTGCEGACCDQVGGCYITNEFDCLDNAGTWHGAGTACVPMPCPLPDVGACCDNNECLQMSEADCANINGTWYGQGTNCLDVNCFDPPGPFGACCQPKSTCVDAITQTVCERYNGTYQGDGTLCADADCDGLPGACCIPGVGCESLRQAQCTLQGGYFQGELTSCTDPNLDCENLGRCCFTDGTCVTTSVEFCFHTLNGPLFSTPGTCDTSTCPAYGACCQSNGTCVMDWDFACNDPGESFQGPGSSCAPNPCGPPCACRGDLNADIKVNGADIRQFVACYISLVGLPPTPPCACADINGDNLITSADVSAFVTKLLTSTGCP